MTSRLLITGYPGWLTNRFLETLQDYPTVFSSIRCLVHPKHSCPELSKGPWECVAGDLSDPKALRDAVRGRDVILHTAAIIHVKKIDDFYKVNRDGTRNLLEAAVAEGVSKLVFISSNAAQGFCEGKGKELDESSSCCPESHYGKSKRQAEEIIEEYQKSGKIQTVILRPAMFYGPPVPQRHLDIYKRVQKGTFPVFGTGDYLRSITYIDHLVQAIHLAIQKTEANGKTFTIIDREIPTLNEMIRAMGEALGVSVKIVKYPKWLAQLAEKLDGILSAMGIYWMLPHIIGEAHKHIAYRIDQAEKILGYDPKINYREGYQRAIDWCFAKGFLERKTSKKKAVFFDRDGVLVKPLMREGKFCTPLSLEEFQIEPKIRELMKALHDRGFLIFVVTNQPDIARKRLEATVLEKMHEWLLDAMGGKDVVTNIYVCPHDDTDHCDCRKPKPGMLLRATSEWGIDLGKSFFVGDHARDVGAGKAAKCKTILIRRDYNQGVEADEVACDLEAAVRSILAADKR